jgi:hypothetical protein
MIYILTCHFATDRWVDLQLAALARHVVEPYRVHAVLDRVPSHGECWRRFHRVLPRAGGHGANLDALFADAAAGAADDDLLIALDSDAWPVADPIPHVRAALAAGNALVAVRRDENLGERQPHPLFAALTAGMWRELGGSWRKGHEWTDSLGRPRTDTGAGMLAALGDRPWAAWLRLNVHNPHPVFHGLYGPAGVPLVYHHGAGSRQALCRRDRADLKRELYGDPLAKGPGYEQALAVRERKNRRRSERIYRRLAVDPDYWRTFMREA